MRDAFISKFVDVMKAFNKPMTVQQMSTTTSIPYQTMVRWIRLMEAKGLAYRSKKMHYPDNKNHFRPSYIWVPKFSLLEQNGWHEWEDK